MGRAERRKASREERMYEIAAMKNKKMGETIKQRAVDETRAFDIDMLMTCFALSERRLYRFGRKRISKSVNKVAELMNDILTGRATLDDYKKELESDAKVSLVARTN